MIKKQIKIAMAAVAGITVITTSSLTVKASDEQLLPCIGLTQEIRDVEITDELISQIKQEKMKEEAYSEEDLRLMSCIIWHEAGNQCEAGMQSVGIVVMNRLTDDSADWGNTIEEILYKPGQFVTRSDSQMLKALKMYDENVLPIECIEAAKYALGGNKLINYEGQEIDMSSYLYFNGHWKNARLRIQDHDFK